MSVAAAVEQESVDLPLANYLPNRWPEKKRPKQPELPDHQQQSDFRRLTADYRMACRAARQQALSMRRPDSGPLFGPGHEGPLEWTAEPILKLAR